MEEMKAEEEMMLTIDIEHYEDLVAKAALLDCLDNAIKSTGSVDENLVKAITGNLTEEPMVPKKEADDYWRYFTNERNRTRELEEKAASLERARADLIEILKQNKIGEYGATEEDQKDE